MSISLPARKEPPLGLPVVGQDKSLAGCGALLGWACLDVPVGGQIECIVALDVPLVKVAWVHS